MIHFGFLKSFFRVWSFFLVFSSLHGPGLFATICQPGEDFARPALTRAVLQSLMLGARDEVEALKSIAFANVRSFVFQESSWEKMTQLAQHLDQLEHFLDQNPQIAREMLDEGGWASDVYKALSFHAQDVLAMVRARQVIPMREAILNIHDGIDRIRKNAGFDPKKRLVLAGNLKEAGALLSGAIFLGHIFLEKPRADLDEFIRGQFLPQAEALVRLEQKQTGVIGWPQPTDTFDWQEYKKASLDLTALAGKLASQKSFDEEDLDSVRRLVVRVQEAFFGKNIGDPSANVPLISPALSPVSHQTVGAVEVEGFEVAIAHQIVLIQVQAVFRIVEDRCREGGKLSETEWTFVSQVARSMADLQELRLTADAAVQARISLHVNELKTDPSQVLVSNTQLSDLVMSRDFEGLHKLAVDLDNRTGIAYGDLQLPAVPASGKILLSPEGSRKLVQILENALALAPLSYEAIDDHIHKVETIRALLMTAHFFARRGFDGGTESNLKVHCLTRS